MNFHRYKPIYLDFLDIVLPYTTLVGFMTGISAPSRDKPFDLFTNIIGYTSIGIISGFTYPISYPIIGGYILYKHNKQFIEDDKTK